MIDLPFFFAAKKPVGRESTRMDMNQNRGQEKEPDAEKVDKHLAVQRPNLRR